MFIGDVIAPLSVTRKDYEKNDENDDDDDGNENANADAGDCSNVADVGWKNLNKINN